ncbi:hypothetical protein JG687_00000580 [Phytophthora cactorum]|uniref:Uncharacterized protein n=1 Tax=Phytophthora cactorum TaxID=29920 RepID=A0A329SNY3_9STRA|nr:hypothetical protein Pcac1_g7926 [Phytophthora cactorum]KAG2842595.1 hypothetical protein PC112_g2960 [Phytophthora cactorum]KAG2842978.1 hypothetical protein PC111_g2534 [Phytophthora cactorum]KAG2866425.1 hypothetical protein PC113_g2867 [Phytophthora cactorum]KAG2931109.1 hypothetical protein PC114_g2242 [Phytophthora cactorum]
MATVSARGDEDEQQPTQTKMPPRYMRPTFSSILPEYANSEADQIRNAFGAGNYANIQKMPARLRNNAVNQARFEKMNENRLTQPKTGKNATKNGLFNKFEYTPSRFSLADGQSHMERLRSEAKRTEISGQDFVSGSAAMRLKHEDAFGATNFRYPHMHEPYPDNMEEKKHKRYLEEKKILHGAFVPSGQRPPVDAVTRKLIPQLIHEMHEVIAADWQGLDISIAPALDENIVVRFNDVSIECDNGVVAYMNVFCKTNRVACKYGLRKVAEDWNSKPGDGGLYFAFRPPWVKNRSKDLIVFVNNSSGSSKARDNQ